jgi:hypothetical protein
MASKSQKDGMRWFKDQFGSRMAAAIKGTPFTIDLLTAIAVQETFEIWGLIYKKLPMDQVLALCVGDSIGGPTRKAFPASKDALLSVKNPDGKAMYDIARAALADVGAYIKPYKSAWEKGKFCHGFGIFQYDLQFFKKNPDYFLKKQWADFGVCLSRVITELTEACKGAKLIGKPTLTDEELCQVAIVYNSGPKNFKAAKGLKQGFYNKGDKTYYGENIFDYLQAAKAISSGPAAPGLRGMVPSAAAIKAVARPRARTKVLSS